MNSQRRLVGPGIPLAMQLKVAALPTDTSTSCGMITKTSPSWTSTSPEEIVLPEFCVYHYQLSLGRTNLSSRIQIQSTLRTLKAMIYNYTVNINSKQQL